MNIDINGFDVYSELDQRFSWKKSGPLRDAAEMLSELSWNKKAIDSAWAESLSEKWWSENYKYPEKLDREQLKMKEFSKHLLTFGGAQVCMHQIDEDLEKLVLRGQLWYPDGTKMMRGVPSQCHSNSALLWDANREKENLAIATGYALSDDGLWRQHSWCVLEKARSVSVVETTVKRSAYYGFVLTKEEAEDFHFLNAY